MGVKSDYRGIVILELFPHCNYSCSFCYQNTEDRPSYFTENHKLFEKSRIYYMNLFLMKYEKYNLKILIIVIYGVVNYFLIILK